MRVGNLRPSPIPSRGKGRLARWACWGQGPLGLDFWPRARFDQRAGQPNSCSDSHPDMAQPHNRSQLRAAIGGQAVNTLQTQVALGPAKSKRLLNRNKSTLEYSRKALV
eukprot:2182960-Alexandrium_andersonii.AAC.1